MKSSGKNSVKSRDNGLLRRHLLFGLFVLSGLVHAESRPSAQAIAINCLSCHDASAHIGEDGIPGLTHLSRQQLRQALLDFKYASSTATLMPRLLRGFSDDELNALAEQLAP